MKDNKLLGIYVHIPFCIRKCKYCDFLSNNYNNEDMSQRNKALAYVNSLINEIEIYSYDVRNYKVSSIYIGGGTPSVIDTQLIDKILLAIRKHYVIDENAEITMEVNPATVLNKKLIDYKNAGINRISIGMQSTHNDELEALGRAHTYEEFLDNYNKFREAGFTNINIDLMSAIPNQTIDTYTDCLYKVMELKPEHISSYSLIIEEGTYFYKNRDKLKLVSEDDERKMYYITQKILKENGYERYEISNYALNKKRSIHNSSYWKGRAYLGFGVGASSYIEDTRFDKIRDINKYIEALSQRENSIVKESIYRQDIKAKLECNIDKLSIENKMEEFMFLGLRMMEGISISDFKRTFNKDIYEVFGNTIKKYQNMGFMCVDKDKIYLTDKGIDVSNVIFSDMLL